MSLIYQGNNQYAINLGDRVLHMSANDIQEIVDAVEEEVKVNPMSDFELGDVVSMDTTISDFKELVEKFNRDSNKILEGL